MGTLQDIIKKELQPTPNGRILGKATLGTPYGFRTCLWGDSMTSQYMGDFPTTGGTYNANTGELTVTSIASDFGVMTGEEVYFYSLNYPDLEVQRFIPAKRVSAKVLSFTIEKNLSLPAVLDNSSFVKNPRYLSGNSWVNWVNIYSGQAFNVVYNGAASGETAKQCYQNIDSLLAYNPEVVFVQLPGVNDWGNPPKFDFDTSWGYAEAGLKKILATGARIIALTITPVRTGEGRANIGAMNKVAAHRQKLFEFGKRHSNILIVDSYSLVVNPTDTTGLGTDYLSSADNIHYSTKGAQKLGKLVWDQIKGVFPVPTSHLPCSVIDSFAGSGVTVSSLSRTNNVVTGTSATHRLVTGETVKISGGTSEVLSLSTRITAVDANTLSFPSVGPDGAITGTVVVSRNKNIYANPLATTAGGTVTAPVTGTIPANMTIQITSGTATVSSATAARSDGFGNDVVVTATPAGASSLRAYFTDPGFYKKIMIPGKKYFLELEVSVTGVSGSTLNVLRPQIWFTLDGISYTADTLEAAGVTLPFFVDNFTGVLKTGVIKLPAGTTVYDFAASLDIGFSGAGSQVVVKFGRIHLMEVD